MLQSEEPVDKVPATACQLCDEWEATIGDAKHNFKRQFIDGGQPSQPHDTLGQFRRHLGRHMEQLALFALPVDEDTMEASSLSEEGYHGNSSVSNADPEDTGNDLPAGTQSSEILVGSKIFTDMTSHDFSPEIIDGHKPDDETIIETQYLALIQKRGWNKLPSQQL
ncbi:hypothetical protein OCU04_007137 [Sclerotinia nivalis]|uniref:Uncharacterized protein n=1 Tax=Sclerotinia nivalis TaxID=352851 RepID=A0A9X0AL76_9HELO|nr:hypothetical protein OCU04_007137 [Sclerotinia nivalis]